MKCSLFALALCAVLAPAISSGPSYRFDADGMAEFRTIDLGKKGLPFRYCFKDGKSPWDTTFSKTTPSC